MNFHFYRPTNEILKKYIEGFYFIKEDKKAEPVSYLTFPNNYCILTINRNFKVEISEHKVTLESSEVKNLTASLVTRYMEPLQIQYHHLIDEITIYFKPLGINYFIEDVTKIFEPGPLLNQDFLSDFTATLSELFNLERNDQITQIEDILLANIKNTEVHLITSIVKEVEAGIAVATIADQHHMSRQYLGRLFKSKLGKTPSEFKKIDRFRKTFKAHKTARNLTELSTLEFYDQSHFNKDFKKFTGKSPNQFFKNVNTEKENIWLFI